MITITVGIYLFIFFIISEIAFLMGWKTAHQFKIISKNYHLIKNFVGYVFKGDPFCLKFFIINWLTQTWTLEVCLLFNGDRILNMGIRRSLKTCGGLIIYCSMQICNHIKYNILQFCSRWMLKAKSVLKKA